MGFYDNDYNKKLIANLHSINMRLAKNDTLTNTRTPLQGGSYARSNDYIQDLQTQGQKYIKSGNSPSYPFLNSVELANYDRTGSTSYSGKVGKGGKMKGGLSWGDIGNFLKPVASTVLDLGANAVGAYTGMPTLANAARGAIKGATGVGLKKRGRKPKTVAGVGVYSGGACSCDTEPTEPIIIAVKKGRKGGAKSAGAMTAGATSGGKKTNDRQAIVRKVMKEMKLSLPKASSYVKQKGLY